MVGPPRSEAAGGNFLPTSWTECELFSPAWALSLLRRAGVDVNDWPSLADYLARMQARPQVKAAIETEMALRKTLAA